MATTTLSRRSVEIPSKVPSSLAQLSLQQVFHTWQDLANEATGHDTEWGYPIALDRIAQKLNITERRLFQQLIQQSPSCIELLWPHAALTFHYPIYP